MTKEGGLDEMGGGIREDTQGEVMLAQLASTHPLFSSHRKREKERERKKGREGD